MNLLPEHRELLELETIVHIATIMPDGSPHLIPFGLATMEGTCSQPADRNTRDMRISNETYGLRCRSSIWITRIDPSQFEGKSSRWQKTEHSNFSTGKRDKLGRG